MSISGVTLAAFPSKLFGVFVFSKGSPLSVIQLSDVTKNYGKHTAVEKLSLSVPAGSLYGFIGPNGSGKTTTIRMILRIIHPDSGTIEVLGNLAASSANDRLGYLPEERGLYKKLSVRRMLGYYAALKGMASNDARIAVEGWLQKFELTQWSSKKIESLSKGMSQKVQFIASIIAHPKILILDEPFSGLDPVNTEAIREAILHLQDSGTTIIFSTHDMSTAERMCDSVFMIHQGVKVLDGTLDEIKSQFGTGSIQLRWDGAREQLASIREVHTVIDCEGYQELQFDGDPQRVLHQLITKGSVQRFEIAQPSLHDIFIRIAGPKAMDSSDSQSQRIGA
ncbi:Daunorubicin/doxorubicin resistance ATP-binding protein DrrA [Planctomycetes bacterium CA13]|uniref:Daunorubicin/doxorubicin resistance ATP-binding protein DrrA n=1 Tax=Novipirellula herctigrandis TaxID=2527986 RepID=A0A5C5Z9R8_9BACT|nr:Daunorubicin/doxorubicin resistance ATP-binding protein DrrA [Planctomycetes bacterium CA13]